MAKQNETTTKFKVDISELVSGMQQAKRQIALANAEFKSATAGMDNWAKSADGISAKLSQLEKTLGSQKSILSNLERQYELTAQQMGAGSKEAENLKIKIENQKASIAKTEKQIKNYTQSLNDIKSESNQSKTAMEKLSDTIDKQESELSGLKKAYANAVLEYGKTSKEARDLAKQIDSLSSDVQKSKRSMNEASDSADDLDRSLEKTGDGAKDASGGFTVMKGALSDLVADGIKAVSKALGDLMTDSADAYAQFSASTGIAVDAMGEYEDAIKNIYKNNFGESLKDVAEKMGKVKEVTGELDASKLQDMTEKAITLDDVFGMDMSETLRGVQSLMTHFGMTSEEAFDYIASGAQNGLNYTDELGDNVSEYAGKFAEAGYSADEYFQLLKNGANGGAYNLDKVNDAINEVTTRLADGTIEDSLGSFSTDTQNVFKAWQEGRATQKDVIDSIVKDIQGAKTEQDKMNLSALAFGTMGEDGGTKFIESLTSVGDSFVDVKGKADDLTNTKYDTPLSALQSIGRSLKVDLLQPIVDKITPALGDLADWVEKNLPTFIEKVKEVAEKLKEWLPLIVGVGTGIATYLAVGKIIAFVNAIKSGELALKLMALAQKALNLVMSLNPIGIVIALIAGLVTAFVILWNKSEKFRNFWIGLWEGIQEIVSTVVGAIGDFFTGLWDDIKKVWSAVSGWFNDNVIQPITKFFKGLWDAVSGFFSDLWDDIKNIWSAVAKWFKDNVVTPVTKFFSQLWDGIVKIFSPAVKWFSDLFTSIWKTLKSIVDVIVALLKGCWEIIKAVFGVVASWFNDNVIKPVTKFFTTMWDTISSLAKKAWETIKGVFQAVASWFNEKVIKPVTNFFKNLWDAISKGAQNAWNFIKGVFQVVGNWFNSTVIQPVTNFFSGMWNKLKSGASQAWEGIKSVFGSVASFFRNTFEKAWTAVKNVFSTGGKIFNGIKEGIVSAFKTIVNGIIKGINKVVSAPFNAINKVLDKIRNVKILNLKPFSGLGKISVPQIPLLYQGGVLKKGQVGYLEGNGDEAVVPLDKNTGWLDEVAKRIVAKGGMVNNQPQTVNNNYNYAYNQTNNSPKALSRLEIYRQTKNQFNYAVGGNV